MSLPKELYSKERQYIKCIYTSQQTSSYEEYIQVRKENQSKKSEKEVAVWIINLKVSMGKTNLSSMIEEVRSNIPHNKGHDATEKELSLKADFFIN